jgi:acyl transferase domain-containing protein
MRVYTGDFVGGVDEFDHEFFQISPRKSTDPQQRILLRVACEALEREGCVPLQFLIKALQAAR